MKYGDEQTCRGRSIRVIPLVITRLEVSQTMKPVRYKLISHLQFCRIQRVFSVVPQLDAKPGMQRSEVRLPLTGEACVQKHKLVVNIADQMYDGVIRMEIGEEEGLELGNNSQQPSHSNTKVGFLIDKAMDQCSSRSNDENWVRMVNQNYICSIFRSCN